MQTSRDGRQVGRSNHPRARRSTGIGRRLAVAIPMFVFTTMALLAVLGLVATVGVFAFYSQGLPDTDELDNLQFVSESVVYDRSGLVELARFNAGEARQPVTFDQIPPILIDAVTSTEDRSFWTNTGVDPVGIASAMIDTIRGRERGASTITQQLVRQRLLDPELVRDPDRVIERKLKEIIQSVRVTDAYPGDAGKRQIITAYLNQNYYGNGSYGIKAAARGYFGIEDLRDLTLGQVALLAGLPQSPSSYDLVRNAVDRRCGHAVRAARRGDPDRRPAQLHPGADGRGHQPARADRQISSRPTSCSRRATSRSSSRPRSRCSASGSHRTSSGRCATSSPRACAVTRRRARSWSRADCA